MVLQTGKGEIKAKHPSRCFDHNLTSSSRAAHYSEQRAKNSNRPKLPNSKDRSHCD
jgi:hypothetical protein